RGRRRHGAGQPSINSLITLAVVDRSADARRAPFADVRRQGYLAMALQERPSFTRLTRSSQPMAFVRFLEKTKLQRSRLDIDGLVFGQLAARLAEELPASLGCLPHKQPFPLAAGAGTAADEPRRHHVRIVQDE